MTEKLHLSEADVFPLVRQRHGQNGRCDGPDNRRLEHARLETGAGANGLANARPTSQAVVVVADAETNHATSDPGDVSDCCELYCHRCDVNFFAGRDPHHYVCPLCYGRLGG
jgi:hypothetical protein